MCVLQNTLKYVEKEVEETRQEIKRTKGSDRIVLIQYLNGLRATQTFLESTSLHTKRDLIGALKVYSYNNRESSIRIFVRSMAFCDALDTVSKHIEGL